MPFQRLSHLKNHPTFFLIVVACTAPVSRCNRSQGHSWPPLLNEYISLDSVLVFLVSLTTQHKKNSTTLTQHIIMQNVALNTLSKIFILFLSISTQHVIVLWTALKCLSCSLLMYDFFLHQLWQATWLWPSRGWV